MRRIGTPQVDVAEMFNMYDKIPVRSTDSINTCDTYRNPFQGVWETNVLMETFFSEANMDILQNGIRRGVDTASNSVHLIGRQDCAVLKTIMRSIYLQHSRNRGNGIREQVAKLNEYVLAYAIPQVYGEVKGYKKYLHDISHEQRFISPPQLIVKRDGKELELKSWF